MNEKEYIRDLRLGLNASKVAAKRLLTVAARKLVDKDQRDLKKAVEAKRQSVADYFHVLGNIKKFTDTLILFLEQDEVEVKNKRKKIKDHKLLFEYLEDAYQYGIEAIEAALEELVTAMEAPIDPERKMSASVLKNVFPAKKMASDDYFFLLNLKVAKIEEAKTISVINRPPPPEPTAKEIKELKQEEEKAIEEVMEEVVDLKPEKISGYAEMFAND